MLKSTQIIAVVCAITTTWTAPAFSDEIARISGLSKRAFMAEYEDRFASMLSIQSELIARFDSNLAEQAFKTYPMTDAEREMMACTYDELSSQGHLRAIAAQFVGFDKIQTMMENDHSIDFVDLMMSEDLRNVFSGTNSDEETAATMSAMQTCNSVEVAKERMSIDPETMARLGKAAAERGLLD
jgi:hypothetical protein